MQGYPKSSPSLLLRGVPRVSDKSVSEEYRSYQERRPKTVTPRAECLTTYHKICQCQCRSKIAIAASPLVVDSVWPLLAPGVCVFFHLVAVVRHNLGEGAQTSFEYDFHLACALQNEETKALQNTRTCTFTNARALTVSVVNLKSQNPNISCVDLC